MRVILLIIVIFLISNCSLHKTTNFEFANKLAKMNLWEEALYRWKKELNNGNKSAAIYNNIAIAYEKKGKYELALEYYKKALKLEPTNEYIKTNLLKLEKSQGIKNEK